MTSEHPELDRITLEELEEELLQARHDLFVEHGSGELELNSIEAEREIEWEELAQEEHAADVRTRLSEQQYSQLRQVDGALERMSRGTYGMCLDCRQPIAVERLRAQPSTPYCADCAAANEVRSQQPPQGHPQDRSQDHPQDVPEVAAETDDHVAGAPLPPELAALDDVEVAQTIREAFRNEVGDELDDVRILCRDGVVILAGEVPNESMPQIARRIVEDEVGYEVIDRLLITEFAGEPGPTTSRRRRPHQIPDGTIDKEDFESDISEDILEVEEEGLTFVPPTRPVPER
ncbi:MAG TPA: TraR/DksA C4-type zinc finger protein [Candidatus Limnocylindrales bacterium]|nr:TraR/DksA C4-type zinc finger protein [Candidatus Limnocylindrales bacterium]